MVETTTTTTTRRRISSVAIPTAAAMPLTLTTVLPSVPPDPPRPPKAILLPLFHFRYTLLSISRPLPLSLPPVSHKRYPLCFFFSSFFFFLPARNEPYENNTTRPGYSSVNQSVLHGYRHRDR